ncbi:MAG: hypothetical protein ACYDDF_12860 [Thermoplasmatota archaeon]
MGTDPGTPLTNRPPGVLLLGPNRPLSGARNPTSLTEPQLIDTRRDIAKLLRTSDDWAAVIVMEDEASHPADGNRFTPKFTRIVREHEIRSYFVLWPRACEFLGVTWELRGLADELEKGTLSPECVELLVEHGVADIADDDQLRSSPKTLGEPGNTTGSFHDLAEHACPIRRWSDPPALRRQVLLAYMLHHVRFDDRAP